MITRTLIFPVIALATFATMVAAEADPENSTLVDEFIFADVETSADETTETPADSDEEATEESTDEPEAAADDADETPDDQADEPVVDPPAEEKQAEPELLDEEPPGDPEPGLAVRVEKLQSGDQAIDPAKVRVLAPFPAKLLAQSPAGWRIESPENAPPFTREVELAPGKHISLSVRPHVLVPDADGSTVFSIPEPGYSAPLGYHQNATVGAILSTSIRQLDKDAGELGIAIEQLQQLLVSLPKTEPVQQTPSAPENPPANPRKR